MMARKIAFEGQITEPQSRAFRVELLDDDAPFRRQKLPLRLFVDAWLMPLK
jgi:hypothetical protein